jgi:hypothetical protein
MYKNCFAYYYQSQGNSCSRGIVEGVGILFSEYQSGNVSRGHVFQS